MFNLQAWDLVLLVLAGYVAVISLVRMMKQRQDTILEELTQQINTARERLRLQKKKERQEELREEALRRHEERREAA